MWQRPWPLAVLALLLPLLSALPAEEDEQVLLPLEHKQPSQLPKCTAAIADSRNHIDSIASQLGVENKLSDRWESQPLFRQSQGLKASNGREVRTAPATPATTPATTTLTRAILCTTITCAQSLAQLVYYIQPKSAHSTIHNHLLVAGAFEGAMERWDAAHPTVLNDPMHVYGRSADASKALAELMEDANPPLEWTVAREPLGHFIAGFDQVEYNCGPYQLLCGNFDDGSSAWHKAFETNRSTHERAQAMLSDLVSQRGPPEYVESLIHIVPQTLGLLHNGGAGIERLSSVGAMEELDSAWAEIQKLMGITTPTAIESHVNPQGGRRQGTQADIEKEMSVARQRILRAVQAHAPWGGAAGAARGREALVASTSSASDAVFPHAFALTQLSQADGERLRVLAKASVKAFAAPSHGTDVPLVHALDSRLAQLAGLGTLQVAQAADGPLHKTLCLLLKREYECLAGLSYTPPTACASVA